MSGKPDLSLEADDLGGDAMIQFRRWFEDAEAEGIHLANAIAMATADAQGRPSARTLAFLGSDLFNNRFEFLAQTIFHRHEYHAHAIISFPRQSKTQRLALTA